jgi:molybdopterin-binding protein
MGGSIGVINAGKILQVGAPDVVLREPTKNYPSVENIFKGIVVRKTSDLAEIDIGDNILVNAITDHSGEVMLQIRPEDLIVSSTTVSSSARNDFTGTITEITDLGATVRLRIAGGKTFTVVITRQSFFEMQLNIGTPVHAICKTTSVHVL